MEALSRKLTIEQVVAAVTQIIKLHDRMGSDVCGECYMPWPCRTVEILKRNFEGSSG